MFSLVPQARGAGESRASRAQRRFQYLNQNFLRVYATRTQSRSTPRNGPELHQRGAGSASARRGHRRVIADNITSLSMRASAAPRQWWGPEAKDNGAPSSRRISNLPGSEKRAGSRFAAASKMSAGVKAANETPEISTSIGGT